MPMSRRIPSRSRMRPILVLLSLGFLAGCNDTENGLSNKNPGLNDRNVAVAFGDSITMGNRCSCAPYPARLSPMIGKTVYNAGINGTMVRENVGRAQAVITRYRPAFMLILYGVNDHIHGKGATGSLAALSQIALICKQNNVVPVLATYPIPFGSHGAFAAGTRGLNTGIRDLAKTQGIKCVDLEKEFASDSSPGPGGVVTDPRLMEADGLHPNEAGTQLMALAFADLF
ncbi:MAG: SGNH/GDSL hydrolase family protein [Opitutae bacterium]|nr:SGNH/GDSL hydrolase family protein [Opitutae bacterium]